MAVPSVASLLQADRASFFASFGDIVFGMDDGTVSIFGLVFGVAASATDTRRALVPGYIVRLAAGVLLPADARLVQATDLHVQQTALTGESLPTEKSADDSGDATESFAESSWLASLVITSHWRRCSLLLRLPLV